MGSSKDENDTSRKGIFSGDNDRHRQPLGGCRRFANSGVPIVSAAQSQGKVTGTSAPKEAESPFSNPPPWPKGTDGHIYDIIQHEA